VGQWNYHGSDDTNNERNQSDFAALLQLRNERPKALRSSKLHAQLRARR
jgi:hypothetical protein